MREFEGRLDGESFAATCVASFVSIAMKAAESVACAYHRSTPPAAVSPSYRYHLRSSVCYNTHDSRMARHSPCDSQPQMKGSSVGLLTERWSGAVVIGVLRMSEYRRWCGRPQKTGDRCGAS